MSRDTLFYISKKPRLVYQRFELSQKNISEREGSSHFFLTNSFVIVVNCLCHHWRRFNGRMWHIHISATTVFVVSSVVTFSLSVTTRPRVCADILCPIQIDHSSHRKKDAAHDIYTRCGRQHHVLVHFALEGRIHIRQTSTDIEAAAHDVAVGNNIGQMSAEAVGKSQISRTL